jgi:hypothetical protein
MCYRNIDFLTINNQPSMYLIAKGYQLTGKYRKIVMRVRDRYEIIYP